MIPYKATGVEVNFAARAKAEADPQVPLGTASTVERATIKEIVQLLARSAKNVVKITTLKLSVNLVQTRHDSSKHRPKGKGKKKFHEVNEQNDGVMDDLAEQVQSLFYNDVHFNAINARMHTTLKCETLMDGLVTRSLKLIQGLMAT